MDDDSVGFAALEHDHLRTEADSPTWSSWHEAIAVVLYRPHLRKTVTIALIVGTVLFCINQLDVVLRGDATAVVWMKSAITYLVPFGVSSAGVLVASKVEGTERAD